MQRVQRGEAGSRSKSLWGDETAPSLINTVRPPQKGRRPKPTPGAAALAVRQLSERRGGGTGVYPWTRYYTPPGTRRYPVALEEWELDKIPQLKANALHRLVAAGKIREIDRERVRFIIRTIVHPPARDEE